MLLLERARREDWQVLSRGGDEIVLCGDERHGLQLDGAKHAASCTEWGRADYRCKSKDVLQNVECEDSDDDDDTRIQHH